MRPGTRRTSRHQQTPGRLKSVGHFVKRAAGYRRHILDRPRCVEQVLMREFALGIGRRVAVGKDPVTGPEDGGVVAEDLLNLIIAPDVEGSFRLVRMFLVGVLRRNAVGVLSREKPPTR